MRKYTIESAIYPVIRVIFRDIRLKKVSLEIEVSGGLWFLLKKHPVHTLNVYALIGIGWLTLWKLYMSDLHSFAKPFFVYFGPKTGVQKNFKRLYFFVAIVYRVAYIVLGK